MTSSDFEITPFSQKELQSKNFLDLAQCWLKDQSFWTIESCIETINQGTHVKSMGAVHKHLGHIGGWYLAIEHDNSWELLFIFTSPQLRGAGIATQLLQDLKNRAKVKQGHNSIFLEVRPSNLEAIRLYEKQEFRLISTRKKYYSNGEDALIYEYNV